MLRNTPGQKLTVFAFDRATNAPVLLDGPNITCRIRIDAAPTAPLADTSATELEDGYYEFDLTQAETNGLKLLFFPESATAGVQVIALPNPCVYTELSFSTAGSGTAGTGEDPGLMEQDGIQADAYIDRWLGAQGVTVPIDTTTASATVVQSLADIGAHLTVWWGFHHRGLDELAGAMPGKSASDIAGQMSGYKDYADEQLGRLLTIIQNENTTDDDVPAGTFEAIDVVDSSEACATDENGNAVAPVSWWP